MVFTIVIVLLNLMTTNSNWFTRSRKNRMMIIQAMVAFVTAEIIGKLAGKFHLNYQPFAVLPDVNKLVDHAVDNSFPSDHTILFFSICFSFWLVRKKTGWLWLMLAFCVANSRNSLSFRCRNRSFIRKYFSIIFVLVNTENCIYQTIT